MTLNQEIQAKFPTHEISVLKLSEVVKNNFRIESEHYLKEYNILKNILKNCNALPLKEFILQNVITGHTPSMKNSLFYGGNINFIKTDNLRVNKITGDFTHKLTELGNNDVIKSSLKEEDLIVTIIGATFEIIGRACLIQKEVLPANINQNIALIRPNTKKINTCFLSIYIGCKYGRKYLNYLSRQTEQVNLNCREVEELLIPIFHQTFQAQIESLVKLAHSKLEENKSLYSSSEKLLLEALGFSPTPNSSPHGGELNSLHVGGATVRRAGVGLNYNIKSFKDSFLTSGRLDAEYYQPKYEELEKYLRKFEMIKLSDLVSFQVTSGSTPKAGGDDYTDAENGIPFVRAVDLVNNRVSIDNFIYIKKSIHNTVLRKTQLKKNDVLFSIAGTVGRCAIFDHNFEANINQAVSILRFDETKIMRICLVVFFNSWVGNMYIEKYARQGVQTNLNLQEVANLEVPILPYSIQTQISLQVQESFRLRAESERLLALAKEAVEVAIEKGEEVAEKLLL